MANQTYVVYFSDSTAGGAAKTGLTPTWVYFNKTSGNTAFTPQPTISELSNGCYSFVFDPDTNGEIRAQMDGGSVLTVASDRFITSIIEQSHFMNTLVESYAAVHTVPTVAQLLLELRALLAENTVAGVTVTTKKISGAQTAHTYTINNAVNPTSIIAAS